MVLDIACRVLGAIALAAALCPLVALLAPRSSTAGRAAALRNLGAAALVVVAMAGAATGWTLPGHAANVVIVWAAFLAAGLLALFAFTMRPRPFALLLGGACVLAWPLAALLALLVAAFEGSSPATVDLGHGLSCRVTVYGSAVGDSGEDVELFERLGPLEHRRARVRQSALHPGHDDATVPGMSLLATLCRARIEQERGADDDRAERALSAPAPR
ncbi:hypothetical protein [uncultured Massilia sp.]|uniref:hypothetical protein n=1 Tax=uncultured Massilia sp. TaxID=169973 RepID=UPI0025E042E5|nr:hypothetical protein [uncultured Massilia sp.]